jgi:hypothetical protein
LNRAKTSNGRYAGRITHHRHGLNASRWEEQFV